ncbi:MULTISPECIES: Uma2 family endonuclease [Fischerella]|uniref:Uma2 family endonuclease n=1 Tax=Fischerella muscicola CCMEE 5323 TaxID=2019572 RepID=A0A2N6K395_FISMU|nr:MULTISPECIES: Uma2 family endonuclease [Fischerella]MBD2432870.1 Uma2 family endonuclease [Fischerella sp. FACHB-380]PLZ89957.1 Uma2 family endonuclease [Fischerella muscicola CCMEE 5323]
MVEQLLINNDDYYVPDASQLVTEDDTPVDNFASEKQQRLLVSTLYSSLQNQTFLAAANVGIYHTDGQPPIVPDVFLSLDVQVPQNWWEKQNRCYMLWKFGKPPEVVIEIVSNKEGDELGTKLKTYEHMRASYYVVYDPTQQLSEQALRIYEIRGRRYFETTETWLEQVGLGLTLWQGEFEGRQDVWLRWCYQDGTLLATGDERAKVAEQRASVAEQRAAQLAERLRSLGIDPDTL